MSSMAFARLPIFDKTKLNPITLSNGSLAIIALSFRPMALRPYLSIGLPLSVGITPFILYVFKQCPPGGKNMRSLSSNIRKNVSGGWYAFNKQMLFLIFYKEMKFPARKNIF